MRKCISSILIVFIGTTLAVSIGQATEPSPATLPSSSTSQGDFVVHEWGTFTTFSGSDGAFLDFRPLVAEHSDLPDYVLDRGSFSKAIRFSKSRLWGRVRMETPVIYFYSDRLRTVDVRVDFPKGLLTEFYPPASQMTPPIDEEYIFNRGEWVSGSSLSWNRINVIPTSQLVPNVIDNELRTTLTETIVRSLLPHASNEQHYAAARETDSALVHLHDADANRHSFEKFLFYRGVGAFTLPISASFENDELVLRNDGRYPLSSAMVVEIDDSGLKVAELERVGPGESFAFGNLRNTREDELVELVQRNLVREGLYDQEASSMVKTWQQSWFHEYGTRILYMLPGPVTDELLPLQVTPQPHNMLRVMVGRMELMAPNREKEMIELVRDSAKMRASHHANLSNALESQPYAIPTSLQAFGRMAEPALVYIAKADKNEVVVNEAKLLLEQYRLGLDNTDKR